jgi:two-component system, response regulator
MFEPLKILVAEDDENDLLLLQIAFSKLERNHLVNVVRDGKEVIDYIQGLPPFNDRCLHPYPSMLLLDLQMPRRTGFDVLEWFLWHPELRPRFVVVLTSSDYPEHIQRTHRLGADAHLVKPQDTQELVRLVKGLIAYWDEIDAYTPRHRDNAERTTVA